MATGSRRKAATSTAPQPVRREGGACEHMVMWQLCHALYGSPNALCNHAFKLDRSHDMPAKVLRHISYNISMNWCNRTSGSQGFHSCDVHMIGCTAWLVCCRIHNFPPCLCDLLQLEWVQLWKCLRQVELRMEVEVCECGRGAWGWKRWGEGERGKVRVERCEGGEVCEGGRGVRVGEVCEGGRGEVRWKRWDEGGDVWGWERCEGGRGARVGEVCESGRGDGGRDEVKWRRWCEGGRCRVEEVEVRWREAREEENKTIVIWFADGTGSVCRWCHRFPSEWTVHATHVCLFIVKCSPPHSGSMHPPSCILVHT